MFHLLIVSEIQNTLQDSKLNVQTSMKRIISTSDLSAIILIRLLVGAVFLSEGLQKFIFPDSLGTGRFIHIGFPHPAFYAGLSGSFEILCGILILAGLFTRPAAFIMLINISVAIVVTKIPILLGYSFGPFNLRELKSYGFWPLAHEIRTDFAMFTGSLFLLLAGAGRWSVDRYFTRKWEAGN
jgi:putative oxidoreductase